jgi:aspartyl-tRNA synthetase
MQDVSKHFRGSNFKVFAQLLEDKKNEVWAIPAPGGGSRTFCDRLNSWAQSEGQAGLGYIMLVETPFEDGFVGALEAAMPGFEKALEGKKRLTHVDKIPGGRGPISNRLRREIVASMAIDFDLGIGDAIFFVAGDPDKFAKFAGLARTKVAQELKLVDENRFEFCWVVDFPMFEWSEEEKRIDFSHNPFSMPQGGLEALTSKDPLTIKAFQYDVACNGYELASGGIRNHRPEAMVKAFEIAGYSEQTVIDRFGGMYRAFHYGAPPHGGMAAGVDRIAMLLAGEQNLREVALFPMNQRAEDLLMGAPSPATPKQLRELHIRVAAPD